MNGVSLAHLSDLHLPLPERPRWRDLMSKRLFSYLSWRRLRQRIHRREILASLMDDVRAMGPAHLAITGDLVNLALPDEFKRAREWLIGQGDAESVTVAPGNHDALVPVNWAQGLGRWAEWMGGPTTPDDAFPFVKRIGDVALIGLSTAVPTAPFMASGRVGDIQLLRLARTLALLGREGLFRIVLLHHPPVDGLVKARKALDDRGALRQVLLEHGAELILHGHSHFATIESVPGPLGPITVVGAPSASSAPGESSEAAGWQMVNVEAANDGWDVAIVGRTMCEDGAFMTRESRTIRVARPAAGDLSLEF